jgi:hypothetical protein
MLRQNTRLKRTFKPDQPGMHWTAERNEREATNFPRVCLPQEMEDVPEMARLANRQQKILFSPHQKR